jgi:hypothetical protein
VRREPKFAQANRGTQQWVHLGEITNAQSGATVSVSCPTSYFCAAAFGDGKASIWNGMSWSTPYQVDPHTQYFFGNITCASSDFCIVSDNYNAGYWFSYDGSSWSQPKELPAILGSTTCNTSHFCMGIASEKKVG